MKNTTNDSDEEAVKNLLHDNKSYFTIKNKIKDIRTAMQLGMLAYDQTYEEWCKEEGVIEDLRNLGDHFKYLLKTEERTREYYKKMNFDSIELINENEILMTRKIYLNYDLSYRVLKIKAKEVSINDDEDDFRKSYLVPVSYSIGDKDNNGAE